MSDALLAAIKEAYACAPSNVAELHTLEISHASIAEPIYIVNNTESLLLTLEDDTEHLFEKSSYSLVRPKKSDEGVQDLDLKICNVDRRVSDFLEEAKNYQTKVVCKYRPYLSTDFTTPQMIPPLMLTLSNVKVTTYEVTARASFADLVNRKFPNEIYSLLMFPSLGG